MRVAPRLCLPRSAHTHTYTQYASACRTEPVLGCVAVPLLLHLPCATLKPAPAYTEKPPPAYISAPHTLQTVVDVVLGDTAVLSRQHARIIYNFTAKKWQLVVEVSSNSSSSCSCSCSCSSSISSSRGACRQPLHSRSQDAGGALVVAGCGSRMCGCLCIQQLKRKGKG